MKMLTDNAISTGTTGLKLPFSGTANTVARRVIFSKFNQLTQGRLTVRDSYGEFQFGVHDAELSAVTVNVHNMDFYSKIMLGGSIGAGESYMQGMWDCSDLTSLVRLFCRNRNLLLNLDGTLTAAAKPLLKLYHWTRHNSIAGSKKNIHAHYDLGNDFFKLFLDESMMYSSAVFNHAGESLEDAALNKIEIICNKLRLQSNDHLLEIGTGWGSLAIHAALKYGCKVTTTTISEEQYWYTLDKVRSLGLENSIDVLKQDYRKLTGRYDKIVSVEMIEAVGHRYYGEFFNQCSRLLKDDGSMLLQAITIYDQHYDYAKHSVDFIQRYIFPGSCIPSITALSHAVTRSSDMRMVHLEDIGQHYALTLKHWRQRFMQRLDEVTALGYPKEFIKMWEFYLAYCEGGFAENAISNVHMVLTKPASRYTTI